MFDVEGFTVNGISLIIMVFGLTEYIKSLLNLKGKKVTVLASLLGALVFTAYQLIGIIPEPYGQVITILFSSLTFGLAASGYYKFASSRLAKP